MKSKLVTLILAIILGLVATASTALYIRNVNQKALAGEKLKQVYVAKKAVAKGGKLLDLVAKKEIVVEKIPARFVAEDSLGPKSDLKNLVLISSLSKGEQVTSSKVEIPAQAELAFKIPDDKVAISIPYDEVIGVSGYIKKGDRVNVIATFTPGEGGKDITRTLLQNVKVLAISSEKSTDQGVKATQQKANLQKMTATLAVTQVESEKLIFAEEKGHVWLALLPVDYQDNGISTVGRGIDSVFD